MYTEMSLSVCLYSFLLVFVGLVFLAVLMRVITAVFPAEAKNADSAWLEAIKSAYAEAYPGTKITKIQAK